ncbi:MAG: 50S ribosomal protein L9 [Armatimonadetes bacterium 13_1_40CM_3_65_7]|nr:MAG: 50S ribosomal protein L9 [Armatimonadetes bacterium 13_1_40CM_3_65_7]
MKVILLKDVDGLGATGSVRDVKEGYARNYLFPRGLAVPATERAVRTLQHQQQTTAQRLQAVVEIRAKGGEGGRLFGSVTTADIAQILVERGFQVDKKQIALDEPIKTAGFFKVPVRVGQGIVAHVDLNVVAGE